VRGERREVSGRKVKNGSGSIRFAASARSPLYTHEAKVAVPARTTPDTEVDALGAEIAELRQLLDRLDGLTHQARTRLRRIEQHRNGVDARWLDRTH
jgi:hypothetical protein